MKTFLSILGIAAAVVMAAVSAAMNFAFLASLGKTEIEGQMLGAASAAADLLKCLFPFFIAWAWREQRYVAFLSGTAVFILFAGFSLLSAIGFASSNRDAVVQNRSAMDESFAHADQEYQRKIAALAALPTRRPATVLAEELRAAQQNRLWSRSKDCTEATEAPSRAFCDSYFRLRAEQAAAEEAVRLEVSISALQAELASLKTQGAGQARDAQVMVLSNLFGLPEGRLRLVLIVAVALVVELGSSLGLYLAAGPQKGPSAKSDADTIRSAERRPIGDIEDFVLAVLRPAQDGEASLWELFLAYRKWCEKNQLDPIENCQFGDRFRELAKAVQLPKEGETFRGVALGAVGT
ncbi:MAG: hypothetical protein C0519_01420 [Hyphomicrobium sp.]|nr:hypothetical protein [Hyphomicrobium sp.]PPD09545.1 MAG: hypothetical protein CTY28_01685 [Hyphomicrobium sp.]